MDAEKFQKVFDEQTELCQNLLGLKAVDYASNSSDRLSQFKREAVSKDSTPLKVCDNLMGKHSIKLTDMINNIEKDIHYSEAQWNEVITDHLNYLFLLKALLVDEGEI